MGVIRHVLGHFSGIFTHFFDFRNSDPPLAPPQNGGFHTWAGFLGQKWVPNRVFLIFAQVFWGWSRVLWGLFGGHLACFGALFGWFPIWDAFWAYNQVPLPWLERGFSASHLVVVKPSLTMVVVVKLLVVVKPSLTMVVVVID